MTLNLTTYEELGAPELEPPARRRSPILALLLSMVFPGLGHLYVGLRRHAVWLIVVELMAFAVAFNGSGTYHANSLLVVPAVYCFAMADAYFSAREWNAGATYFLTGANPRIAAILNLLTKGFGYFYLGDRTKGIVCFLIVSAVQAALLVQTNIWTSILAISIQILIAGDGYRVARQRLLASHPNLEQGEDGSPGAIELANPGGLQPAPASIFFLSIATIAVLGYATLRALSGKDISTGGSLEQGPAGLLYRNVSQHIELTAPSDWEYSRPENCLIQLSGDGSSIIVVDQYAIYASESAMESNRTAILKDHPDATIVDTTATLADSVAHGFEAAFLNKSGLVLHQRLLVRRRGIRLVLLIETWALPGQRKILDGIELTTKV